MEGVGARLGRSSNRFAGPSTAFNGPVRKWKKRWVAAPLFPAPNYSNNNKIHSALRNGSSILFFKWTLFSQNNGGATNNSCDADKPPTKDDVFSAGDELLRRKFKYFPTAMLEKVEDESKAYVSFKRRNFGNKPDMNDLPMEENQAHFNHYELQDLNESTFDLSLA